MFTKNSNSNIFANDQAEYKGWQSHMALGRMAFERGLYAAAARNYHSALKKAEQQHLSSHEMVTNLLGLATCDNELGETSECESLLKRVLEIEEVYSASYQGDLAEDLNSLASLYMQMGRTSEAESVLRKALAISDASYSDADVEVKILTNLAKALCVVEQSDEAEQFLNRGLGLFDTRSAKQSKAFADLLAIKAAIAARRNNNAESKELIQQAIEVMELVTGGLHPDLATLIDMAARIWDQEGNSQEAAAFAERAAAIRRHLKQIDR